MERLIRSSSIAFGIKGSTPTSKDREKTEQTNFHHFFYKCGSFLTAWKLLLVINIFAHYFVEPILKLLLLKITYQRFPYNEETVGTWFSEQIYLPQSSSGTTQLRTIHMMNIIGKPSKIQRYGPITECLSKWKQNGFEVLFHGTTHSSAKDIIENGIRLDRLKEGKQDFSCGKGFYLTDKFEGKTGALLWSFNRFSHEHRQAVVIFTIPRAEIDRYKDNSKDFKENKDGLKAWVKKYRFGDGTPQRDLERNLRGVSFVEGPWVKKVDDSIMPIEGSYQICLHSEELAECFNRYLHAAIFVNKQETS